MSILKNEVSDADHAQGHAEAACTLVEYGDYECPHCAHAYPIVKRVQKHFGDRLRFVFRNFPLTQIHYNAEAAAEVAEFAGSEGKFWQIHDLLFENQPRLSFELYEELCAEAGLDTTAMKEALDDGSFTARVRSDFTGGVRSGVNGTPTFFINGRRHNGPFEFDSLVRAIGESIAL